MEDDYQKPEVKSLYSDESEVAPMAAISIVVGPVAGAVAAAGGAAAIVAGVWAGGVWKTALVWSKWAWTSSKTNTE
jgi:hypothetical protein